MENIMTIVVGGAVVAVAMSCFIKLQEIAKSAECRQSTRLPCRVVRTLFA